ncbi:LLM class flavin-dependent oxidoreductase [Nocardioides sp.]|uniref:LLM class flavin-dependent oxidoreductase n=1 Tax=Nocardioides sp. TaxID=35761 RepID=UPI0025E58159|nr:LLM class flavin-dependent oxidoreductase [Nocardioides sp.]
MRIGLAVDLSSAHPVRAQVDHTVALLAHAEANGLDSVWVGESYHRQPEAFHLPASLIVLGHLAGRTRLHLGTAVLLLRAHPPERLAYEAALLDQLCEGRFTLGIGLGAPEVGRRAGVSTGAPAGPAFDAALAILRAAWSDLPSAGPDGVRAVPAPVQRGGPRILVGGKTAASVRRAADLADGFYGATNYTDGLLATQAAAFWARRGEQAHEAPGEVATTRFCLVHEDPATARALAARYFAPALDYYTGRGAWVGADGPAAVELPLVGSPAEVAAAVARYARAGVTSLQLRVAPVGTPAEIAHRTISLVGDHVVPPTDAGDAG